MNEYANGVELLITFVLYEGMYEDVDENEWRYNWMNACMNEGLCKKWSEVDGEEKESI